jgi:chemotaxis signal transduction protein
VSGGRIDWDEVKRRLEAGRQALERGLAPDGDELEGLYRARAAQLAARRQVAEVPATALRVLVCRVGSQRYAIDFQALMQVLAFADCTPVPGGVAALLGVCNIDGAIRSVVDLGALLGLPDRHDCTGGYVLLLREPSAAPGAAVRHIALRVDDVAELRLLAPAEIGAAADAERAAGVGLVRGITGDRLRVLEIGTLFAALELGAAEDEPRGGLRQ